MQQIKKLPLKTNKPTPSPIQLSTQQFNPHPSEIDNPWICQSPYQTLKTTTDMVQINMPKVEYLKRENILVEFVSKQRAMTPLRKPLSRNNSIQ